MACFDKKLEASRLDFFDEGTGAKEVDCVLTSSELLDMMLAAGDAAPPTASSSSSSAGSGSGSGSESSFSSGSGSAAPAAPPASGPPTEDRLGRVLWELLTAETAPPPFSAVASNGASGGFAEDLFRHAAREIHGISIPASQPLPWRQGRNADIREVELVDPADGDTVLLRFAIANGFRNISSAC